MNKLLNELDQGSKNKIFSKAFFKYFQEKVKNSPEIILPTERSLNFYRTLSIKAKLHEELIKFYILNKLPLLQLGDNFDKANQLLQKYRTCQLVKLTKPGALSNFLEIRGLISKDHNALKSTKTQSKKVRFF